MSKSIQKFQNNSVDTQEGKANFTLHINYLITMTELKLGKTEKAVDCASKVSTWLLLVLVELCVLFVMLW